MRLDSFLEPEPQTALPTYGGIRRHTPGAPEAIISGPGLLRRLNLVPPVDMTWKLDGACRGKPIDWWFPTSEAIDPRATDACSTCAVRERCLQHALDHPDECGVWGGTSERERRRLRRQRRRAS